MKLENFSALLKSIDVVLLLFVGVRIGQDNAHKRNLPNMIVPPQSSSMRMMPVELQRLGHILEAPHIYAPEKAEDNP